jgi:hypothetical protein
MKCFETIFISFIYNGLAPQYLYDLIPPTIQSTTIYPLRNGSDLIVPFCRLSSTNSSFFETIFISFALLSNARLNFNGVSRLRTDFSSLFHSLTEEGINDEFVEESLQKGTIRSLVPFKQIRKITVRSCQNCNWIAHIYKD